MTLPRRVATVVLTLSLVAGLAVFSGCTKYASQDDLAKLDEAKKAAASADKELSRTKAERKKVEAELSAKETELKAAQDEFEKVKGRVEAMKAEEGDE